MKKLNFSFSTKLTFDNYVNNHSFALRCIPIESPQQIIKGYDLNITPYVHVHCTVDAFGNNIAAGYLEKEHRFLDFEISGRAETDITKAKTDYMPCYLYQSEYTKPDEAIKEFYNSNRGHIGSSDPALRGKYFSDILSETITYSKGKTNTKTTAAEAFKLGEGVCQDFSHILLSLLRLDGIACRYMSGLASCDGETHSWIELWNGEKWVGIDPANNRFTDEDYLVLSQGRDFADCSIDRGVMFGGYTRQMQLISSKLTENYY